MVYGYCGKDWIFLLFWMFKNDCLWFMSIVGKSWRISFVYGSGSNYIVFWFTLRLHSLLKVKCEFRYKSPNFFPLRDHWKKEINKQKIYIRDATPSSQLRLYSVKFRCEFRYKNPKKFPLRGHWKKTSCCLLWSNFFW